MHAGLSFLSVPSRRVNPYIKSYLIYKLHKIINTRTDRFKCIHSVANKDRYRAFLADYEDAHEMLKTIKDELATGKE